MVIDAHPVRKCIRLPRGGDGGGGGVPPLQPVQGQPAAVQGQALMDLTYKTVPVALAAAFAVSWYFAEHTPLLIVSTVFLSLVAILAVNML